MKKTLFFSLIVLAISGCSRNIPFEPQILSYDGNKVERTFAFDGGNLSSDGAGQWDVDVKESKVSDEATDYSLTFTMKSGEMASGGAAVRFEFDNWSTENYVFAPCYLYGGNRFRIMRIGYAPFIYDPADRPLDMPITTTNIPHLSSDGSDSYVDFKTSSCATPLAGFYDKSAKKGFFILTGQDTVLGDEAFFINEYPSERRLTIRLSAPGVREHRYVMCNADNPSGDKGVALKAGDSIKIHFRVYDFPCEDLMAYFDKFLTIRKDLSGQNEYRYLEPFSSIGELIYQHHFEHKWYEDKDFGYVCNRPWLDSPNAHLSIGWSGAPTFFYAMSTRDCADCEEILRRFARQMESILYSQQGSGFFNARMKKGEFFGDSFKERSINRDVATLRRQGVLVYFSLQCFDMLKSQGKGELVKPEWEEMIRKAADALCALHDRYGEFGQSIKATTGELYVPNSTCGARCVAALAYASKYFGEPRYLEVAKRAGQRYYDLHLSRGYVGGCPGDILQSPDSEASADLLNSYVSLYEITRDKKWLKYARDAASFFSSWVVSYDYKFPEKSIFGQHDVKSAGSVWASVQNEHSAPGIYVMSGDFLLKIFRATGDKRYLELIRDIAHNAVQYVNTEGNHIQREGGFGFTTERVNIGDWEGIEGIGNIPQNDSNIDWELMVLLKCVENPGIYVQPDKGEITVFDHVKARIVSGDASSVTLEITNPTYRDGDVSVLAETSDYARSNSLGWNAFYTWPKVHVPSGETVTVTLPVKYE